MIRNLGDLIKSSLPWIAPIIFVAVVLFMVREIPGLRNLVIEQEEGVIRLKLESDGKIDITTFLNGLSASQIDKDGTIKWMKKEWGLYDLSDPDLLVAIKAICPPIDMSDITLYEKEIKKCDSNLLTRNLRQLAKENKPPFQPQARTVRIGTPSKRSQPSDGTAYTCYDGGLENERVLLVVEGVDNELEVTVRGGYECVPGKTYPDLQLNQKQAHELFNRKTREIETAIAVPM